VEIKLLLLPISEFCKTGSGTTPSRTKAERYFGGGIPWVKSGELRESIVSETEETVTSKALAETSLKIAPKGAVLVAMYGANVGRVGILGIDATTNQAICHIVPDEDKADSRYIFHALQAKLSEFLSRSVGGAQPNISQQIIRETKISLPPIATQKRIAAILDQAEALRSLRREAIGKLDELGRSVFLEMFGDPVMNPKGWKIHKLADFVSEFRYGSSNKSQPHGKPILRIPNVVGGTLNLTDLKVAPVDDAEFERLKMQDGDILFVRTNGNPDFVGRCAVFDRRLIAGTEFSGDDYIFASYLIRARLASKEIETVFLREFLLGSSGRRQLRASCKTSAGQFNVNIPSLSAISVPLPPLPLQQEFAKRIEAIEALKAIQREAIVQLDALFASLQHRAFRGEL
jgi:type I restriction enzyme, S subunit